MTHCAHCGAEVAAGAAFCPSCGRLAAGQVATSRKSSSKALFLVLGCVGALVALLFVAGIFAALLIPNFLDALHKAKQKRAVAELRTMGQAIELYKAEHGYAPAATDMASLAAALGGRSSSSIPRVDPWKHPYRYVCWQESPAARGCDHYRIGCAGRDGRFEQVDLKAYGPAELTPGDYDRDIVYGDGELIVRPRAR